MAKPDKKTTGKPRVGDGTPGPGRPKGMPNKTTSTMKEAIAAVYEKLQRDKAKEDGDHTETHAHFANWAKDHPTEFYRIAAKLLPLQLSTGDDDGDGGPAGILIKFVKTDEPG
jgi:hypothetical protein